MIQANDLTPADYNPRDFSKKALEGLDKSMQEFLDISGITWNKRTRNIVTGHHRWKLLCESCGIDNLKFKEIKGTDRFQIFNKRKDTGYLLRVVDWSIEKEKAANVMANSGAVAGEFTADLQTILGDIKLNFDAITFDDLNLPDLEIPEAKQSEKSDSSEDRSKKKKSETVISGGGEKYKIVKLELSPILAERFRVQLDRFKGNEESVERPLEVILDYLESKEDEEIIPRKKARKRK